MNTFYLIKQNNLIKECQSYTFFPPFNLRKFYLIFLSDYIFIFSCITPFLVPLSSSSFLTTQNKYIWIQKMSNVPSFSNHLVGSEGMYFFLLKKEIGDESILSNIGMPFVGFKKSLNEDLHLWYKSTTNWPLSSSSALLKNVKNMLLIALCT